MFLRFRRLLIAENIPGLAGADSAARAARVDRTFLYRHRDLLEQIHVAISAPPGQVTAAPLVSRASLQADLVNAHERNGRLAARVRQLETRLSEALGEQAWHESGLGAPEDIDALKRRIAELEQELVGAGDRLDLAEQQQPEGPQTATPAANRRRRPLPSVSDPQEVWVPLARLSTV